MNHLTLQQLIPVIQTATGPVILISGVGLVLLSLTNRYGRINDRARLLIRELPDASSSQKEQVIRQLQIIHRRARITRIAILLSTTSVLLAGLLILVLFTAALLDAETGALVVLIFMACVASLVLSLLLFLAELHLSLKALRVELREAMGAAF
jgi:hypothetical protein